jgi:hypothetical protein
MKRVGVFLFVGPLLGLVMAMILTARVSPPGPSIHISAYFLMAAYLASLLLAIVSASMDLWLAGKSWMLLGTACAGAVAAVLEMMLLHGQVTALELSAFVLFGAIPPAVCSWVTGWTE